MAAKLTKFQLFMQNLFDQMQHCPICAKELQIFGSRSSERKVCPDGHGTALVKGNRQGQGVGIFFEVHQE